MFQNYLSMKQNKLYKTFCVSLTPSNVNILLQVLRKSFSSQRLLLIIVRTLSSSVATKCQ